LLQAEFVGFGSYRMHCALAVAVWAAFVISVISCQDLAACS